MKPTYLYRRPVSLLSGDAVDREPARRAEINYLLSQLTKHRFTN